MRERTLQKRDLGVVNRHYPKIIGYPFPPVCGLLIVLFCICSPAPAATIPFESPADKTLYRLAQQNDPAAQYLIGRKYFTGTAVEKKMNEAIKWFELAATQKHTKAQFQLGKIYLYGESGIEPNPVYALGYLREAAKSHYAEAQYEMGNYYLMDKTENANYPEAIKWYRAAAEQQHVRAMVALGKILNEGRGGIKPQPDEAKHLLSLAAESGNTEAMQYLRDMVRNTSATFRNAASITEFHAKLNDAAAGHIPSQYEVGMAYLKGNGVDADVKLAAKWLRRAAMNDHSEAQYILSQLYRDGVGVEKNRKRALEWLKIASSAGVKEAQKELRSMHLSQSVLYDMEEYAAETHHQLPLPQSSYSEASTPADPESTEKAATETPSEPAPQQSKRVKTHAKQPAATAEAGLVPEPEQPPFDLQPTSPEEQYILANRYLNGTNMEKSAAKAAYWFELAAAKNHVEAQYQIGEMYKQGIGVTASVAKAKFWLNKAANADIRKAQISLNELASISTISPQPAVVKTNISGANFNTATEPNHLSPAELHTDMNSRSEKTIDRHPAASLPSRKDNKMQANAAMIGDLGQNKNVSQHIDEEIKALLEAANNNDPGAQVKLAEMYRKGRGVERDLFAALEWYQKAAAEGDADAQFHLGDMYKEGLGVEKNNALAIKWFRKAANQGHQTAKRRLGGCRIC